MNTHDTCCPPPEDLSALFDAETGLRSGPLRQHLRECPHCSARFEAFGVLRERLGPLQRTVDVDVAEAVLMRLPRRSRAAMAPSTPPQPRRGVPWFGGRALGAAAALGAGWFLGFSVMVGAGGVTVAGMTVFEAEPIGGFCAGLPSCVQLRR